MENNSETSQPPFAEQNGHDLLPYQGSISESYKIHDEETGKFYVHKIVDFDKSWRYGEKTPLERAKVLQRIHGVLNEVFAGKVASTQFLIAKSSGVEKIEAVQPYIEGVRPNSPSDVESIHKFISDASGGEKKLINKLQKEAGISNELARMTAYEITASTNWIKDSKTGEFMLIDF